MTYHPKRRLTRTFLTWLTAALIGTAGHAGQAQPSTMTPSTTPSGNARLPRMHYADPTGVDTKDPSVIKFSNRYWMYYSVAGSAQTSKNWTIGIATSTNLRDWTFAGRLLPETDVEKNGLCAPGAIVLNGKVHLFYQSYGSGPKDAILHAVSDDGLKFVRDETSPVFRPTGDWTSGRAIDAEAFVVGDQLHLYYATRDRATSTIQMVGIASAPLSSDFSRPKWTHRTTDIRQVFRPTVPTVLDDPKLDLAWEDKCIEAPSLLKHKEKFYLFYAGAFNNHPQQIGVAVSDDGITFRRLNGGAPILAPGAKGSWNASESGHPGVFQDDDGRDYLFFQGDNTPDKMKWRLSMAPIRWQTDPNDGPDVPMIDIE